MKSFQSSFGPIELTDERQEHILKFHPEIRAYKKYFKGTISDYTIIKHSKYDPVVVILYKQLPKSKYLAIVVRLENSRNFILTAYLTSKI
ncbi:hypothetical protein HY061_01180 [Candidatus Azambacteria bacterium]|nr:hypothetical protein [Candidatus Azambacteria bacterium]